MENWLPVKGYENDYKVSESGIVMSLNKKWITGRGIGKMHFQKGKIIAKCLTKGYYRVSLWQKGVMKHFYVHQVVARAFCKGEFEGSQVNHKDGNRFNNHFTNLEFIKPEENITHAFETSLRSKTFLKEWKSSNQKFSHQL